MILSKLALDKGDIALFRYGVPLVPYALRERFGLGEHHHAARFAVQPMDEPHARAALELAFSYPVVQQVLDRKLALTRGTPMKSRMRSQNACRLVHDDKIAILVYYGQGRLFQSRLLTAESISWTSTTLFCTTGRISRSRKLGGGSSSTSSPNALRHVSGNL